MSGTKLNYENHFEGRSTVSASALAQEAIRGLETQFNVTSSKVQLWSRTAKDDEEGFEEGEEVWVAKATVEGWM